jgi:DNA-binding transcriptional MocR family regulator
MDISVHRSYQLAGRTSIELVHDLERALRQGQIGPGERLPPVRRLAEELGLSPATVASAYRELARRGVTSGGAGRAGTRVRQRPPVATHAALPVPPEVRDLRSGEPDPLLLPERPGVETARRSYADSPVSPRLRPVAEVNFSADGVDPSHLAVVGGALDGVERVLTAWLRPGDKVAVEDPCYSAVLDLVAAMGFEAMPVAVDELGARPEALRAALDRGASAAVLTPRAQNPTGAAWDEERAGRLRAELVAHRDVLVVEDDHAGPVAGAAFYTLAGAPQHWATVRSVSKWLGPDLRVAVLAGDEATVAHVEGRQALGTGWVSYLLQDTVAVLWSDPAIEKVLERATATYAERRRSLERLLRDAGHPVSSRSGLTTWVAVDDEFGVVSRLMQAGWAVSPGERFRLASPPAIRVGHATLRPDEAARFVADLSEVLGRPPQRSA